MHFVINSIVPAHQFSFIMSLVSPPTMNRLLVGSGAGTDYNHSARRSPRAVEERGGWTEGKMGCEWQVKRINCCGIWRDNATLIMISICAHINPIKRRMDGQLSCWLNIIRICIHEWMWPNRNWFIATCYKLLAIALNKNRSSGNRSVVNCS